MKGQEVVSLSWSRRKQPQPDEMSDPPDQDLPDQEMGHEQDDLIMENQEETNDKHQVSSVSTRHSCLSRCFGYNKKSLCWIGFLFLIVVVLTTTLTTRNNYSASLNKDWVLVGAITENSATFRIRTDTEGSQAQSLVVSLNDEEVITQEVSYNDYVDSIVVDGLDSNTRYEYQTKTASGSAITSGSFTTSPPANARFNFSIATAGCAWTASKETVFSRIAELNPLLFIHLGDFHYLDINSQDVQTRIEAMDQVLSSPSQAELFTSTSIVSMWDDHDYLGNDSEGYEKGREAALEGYTLGFPHYTPLPASLIGNTSTSLPVPPYHAFTIGTVRFIISDLRSESTPASIYSDEQKNWLFDELRNATAYDFVVWLTSKPWIGPVKEGDDSWSGHPNDRAELSQHISEVVTSNNLLAISSDAHMLAFDDGRNTYYGTNENASSFPILQSGPLDRLGSTKGGPFSDGCYTVRYERNHQFSTIDFVFPDNEDDESCMEITSYRVSGDSREVILTKRLCGEIFTSSIQAGTGSCDSTTLSGASIALVSVAGLLVVGSIATACWFFGRCEALKVSAIVIVCFFLTLVAGIGIPLAMSVSQYDTTTILIVLLLQMVFTFIFIMIWALKVRASKD
jgi:hypothetical protein